MNRLKSVALCALASLTMSAAMAETWTEGTVTEIRVISTGTPSNDGVLVLGTFSPSLGCANSGFMIFSGDPYFNQAYAALLAAQASGAHVKLLDWYCLANGYARGNGYAIKP
jgi:hypothetical protein